MNKHLLLSFIALLFAPLQVFAHGAHGTGFVAGITHPVFGLDHLAAIIGFGIISFSILATKKWLPSAAFVLAMILGGYLGVNAEPFLITEWIIVGSVLLTGLMLGIGKDISLTILLALGALFGFFHGHAHGVEMPTDSNVGSYILGFIIATSILSLIGASIAIKGNSEKIFRFIGGLLVGMSITMFLG